MKALKELLSELTFTCERGNLEKKLRRSFMTPEKL